MKPQALALLLLAVVLARAEDKPPPPAPDAAILAAIDKGRAAVAAGKAQDAVAHLHEAIRLIQETAIKGLAAFLPKRDKPWTMGEIDTSTGTWGTGKDAFQWAHTSRAYELEEQHVTVTISTSPQLIEAQRAGLEMLRNPQMRAMLQSDENRELEVVEADGWLGMVTTDAGGGSSVLAMHKKVMVSIDLAQGDAALAKEFWEAIDRKGLGEAVK